MSSTRLILYHKHPVSARTRFLRFAHGGVCGPEALPAGCRLAGPPPAGTVVAHPAMLLRTTERSLALPGGSLEHESGLRCRLLDESGGTDVYVARFTGIDPPVSASAAIGADFIDLTQARGLPAVELALLRRVYEHVLG